MADSEPEADEDGLDGLPTPGDVIAGKYEVESVIGQGGIGLVVAARHQQLNLPVAIKFLRAEVVGDEQVVARFLQEARAAVSIRGEHVARVLDVGTLDNGAPFTVMEHLEGCDLEDLLEEDGVLDVEDAVDFVLQACEAIAEAHACSIVHRDLKPANLFLSARPDGSALVKVLDFGIAKALDEIKDGEPSGLTVTGTALGTPIYMSPEQVRDSTDVDGRTDIWGLGTTLHHLLSGNPPFEANTVPALCAKIIADAPPSLSELRPGVPAALAAIVARCLEKDRKDRYQTVAVLARDLARFAPERSRATVEAVGRIVEGPKPGVAGARLLRDSMADTIASSPGTSSLDDARHGWLSTPAKAPGGTEQAQTQNAAVLSKTTPSSRMIRRRGPILPLAAAGTILALGATLVWTAPWSSRETAPSEPGAIGRGTDAPISSASALAEPPPPRAVTTDAATASVSASSSVSPSASARVAERPKPGPPMPPGQGRAASPKTAPSAPPPPPQHTGDSIDPLQDRR